MRAFVDTNLWIYRFDRREPEKRKFTRNWLRGVADQHEIVISTQVMVEFRSVATRKLRPALAPESIEAALLALARFEVVPSSSSLILDANRLATAHQLAWFDALIVEAAIRSHCDVLYSEDLDHGRTFGALTIRNPLA